LAERTSHNSIYVVVIMKRKAGIRSLPSVAAIRLADGVADGVIGGRPLLAVFGGHPIWMVAMQAVDIKRSVGSHKGGTKKKN